MQDDDAHAHGRKRRVTRSVETSWHRAAHFNIGMHLMTIPAARPFALATLLAIVASWSPCSFAEELTTCISGTEATLRVYCYAQEADRLQQVSDDLYLKKLREFDNLPAALAIADELKESARSHFVAAQHHWREYEEEFCGFQADTNLGSGSALVQHTCRIELIKVRIAELQASGF